MNGKSNSLNIGIQRLPVKAKKGNLNGKSRMIKMAEENE